MIKNPGDWFLVLVATTPDGYPQAHADWRVRGSREAAKVRAQQKADEWAGAQAGGWRYRVDVYDYDQWERSDDPKPAFTVKPSKARAAAADKAYRAEEARRSHDWDAYFKITKAHKKNPRPFKVGAKVQDEYGNLGVVEEVPKSRGAHYWVRFPEGRAFLRPSELKPARKKNPFTGNGWTEEKAWIREAKATTPTPFGAARANAIIAAARKGAIGPWSDRLTRVMKKGEYAYVDRLWATMPGSYSFVSTLNHIAQGG